MASLTSLLEAWVMYPKYPIDDGLDELVLKPSKRRNVSKTLAEELADYENSLSMMRSFQSQSLAVPVKHLQALFGSCLVHDSKEDEVSSSRALVVWRPQTHTDCTDCTNHQQEDQWVVGHSEANLSIPVNYLEIRMSQQFALLVFYMLFLILCYFLYIPS